MRTVEVPDTLDLMQSCAAFTTPNAVACTFVASAPVIIDVEIGAIRRLPGSATELSVTGDVAFVGSFAKSGVAYDVTGRRLWSSFGTLDSSPQSGSPVVGQIDGAVFSLRDIRSGVAVYTRDVSKSLAPETDVQVAWTYFRSGFAVRVADSETFELFDRKGARTAAVREGWTPVPYSHDAPATPLPVFTNHSTDEVASVEPATGQPAVTAHLRNHATEIENAAGTKIAVSYTAKPGEERRGLSGHVESLRVVRRLRGQSRIHLDLGTGRLRDGRHQRRRRRHQP